MRETARTLLTREGIVPAKIFNPGNAFLAFCRRPNIDEPI